jgi:membrane-associated phospholipid phosphatase
MPRISSILAVVVAGWFHLTPAAAQTNETAPTVPAGLAGPAASTGATISPGSVSLSSTGGVGEPDAPATAESSVPGAAVAQGGGETVEQKPPADEKPPIAVGEEGTKPTRRFLSALGHNLVDDVKHYPRRSTVYWLAGGGALALAIHPEDGKINRHLIGNATVDTLFKPGKWIGNDGVFAAGSLGTYFFGRAMNMPRAEHLGMDETEALILAAAISEVEKEIVRRPRPVDPFGHSAAGFSFPSGHATLTFAAATVLQQHLGYKAAIPTYLIASYVAMSRLHDNVHYASDVIFGAANGIVIGRTVTWHGRHFWGNLTPVPVPGGMALVYSKN